MAAAGFNWTEFRRRATAPWSDRSGKFAPLKAAVFAVVLFPVVWWWVRSFTGDLGAVPITTILRESGLWAIRFLVAVLAITPLRKLLAWPKLVSVRRMLGVAALVYTLIHLFAYFVDSEYMWGFIATEIVLRLYLLVGTVALVLMIPLGITSTDEWVKRMGGARWRTLHKLVYWIGVLAVLHFYLLLQKLTTPEAQILAGLFLWLMAWRGLVAWRGGIEAGSAAILAVASGLLTMALEVAYFAIFTSIPASRLWLVFSANWSLEAGVRPGWIVMGVALAATLTGVVRGGGGGRRRPAPPQRS